MNKHPLLLQKLERRRQKDEFLKRNVIRTDPPVGHVQWHVWSHVPGGAGLGHGVHYHDVLRPGDADVVAFIRGFAWQRHNWRGVVAGYYLRPDAVTTPAVMTELRRKIDSLVADRARHYYPKTWLTDRIYALGNC